MVWSEAQETKLKEDEYSHIKESEAMEEEQVLLKLWTDAYHERGVSYTSYAKAKGQGTKISMHQEHIQVEGKQTRDAHESFSAEKSSSFHLPFSSSKKRDPLLTERESAKEVVDVAAFLSSQLEEACSPSIMYNASKDASIHIPHPLSSSL